jgi:pimeloyl-ACP methyl ester carboxylesterase
LEEQREQDISIFIKKCNPILGRHSYRNPLPDVPVHFIQAGGFGISPDEPPTIYDREKLFRINSTLQRDRWLELLYPLKNGRFFYASKSGHAVQIDDPELVIACIRIALNDYNKLKKK